MRRPPWFGRLLKWRVAGDDRNERVTEYAGREIRIGRLDRADADANNTRPGWHLLEEVDGYERQLGGHLGNHVDYARQMAEVLIVGGSPWYNYHGKPLTLHSIIGGAGPIRDLGDTAYVFWPDDAAARILVRRYYLPGSKQPYGLAVGPKAGTCGPVVAEMRPEFWWPDEPAVEPIRIGWQVQPAGSFVRTYSAWDDAFTALDDLLSGATAT